MPFFSISGSDFVEMFVGVGASRVRDLFEEESVTALVSFSLMKSMRWPEEEAPVWAEVTMNENRR